MAVQRAAPILPDLEQRPVLTLVPARRKPNGLVTRSAAMLMVVAVLVTLGGSGRISDPAGAFALQSRAAALHMRWIQMLANGVPDSDLAELQQEWAYSEQTKFLGVGVMFWGPGGQAVIDRWQAQTDATWARDLSLARTGALMAEQSLHRALGREPRVTINARLDALAAASTPKEFATLRANWGLEARLVPIDRRIAAFVGQLTDQSAQATALGILSTPAADFLGRADGYSVYGPQDRMARAEMLTRGLIATQKDLQSRLDAAAITLKAFGHVNDEIDMASLYGLDLSGYQARIASDHAAYAAATTADQFDGITADLNQIAAAADHAIYVALSQTHVISGITFIYQNHPLSCEEAATSMALTHQGISLSQDQILADLGSDRRPKTVDANGRVRWGNPYLTFVGNVEGSESNFTGYGTYYPPLVRIARAHGARVIAYGSMSAATIYARVIAGHPVVAFSTWDWAWHPRHDYLSFDGQWIPFIGPGPASHVYVVAGVSATSVLIYDPIRGQYWISKDAFQAGYSDFNEAIVFA